MPSAAKPPSKPPSFFVAWRAEWPKIAAGLTTAFLLFLASLAFEPVRQWLFPAKDKSYPLFCTAEQEADMATGRMMVRFYIVNRTGEEFTDETLKERLAAIDRRTGGRSTPLVTLTRWRNEGRVESAQADRVFNGDKGEISVRPVGSGVAIRVSHIMPRAILRVTIPVAGLPDLQPEPLSARAIIPLNVSDYVDACYGRS
jgi:hypothetical protein